MSSRYFGKVGRGASRKVRIEKREEAEKRNAAYQLKKSLESSAAGDVADLGDFTQYAE